MSAKEENIDLILRKLIARPRRWSELMGALDVSEATLSRYLNDLRDKNLIEKEFDSKDNVVYTPNIVNLLTEDRLEIDFIERSQESNKLISELKDAGLFGEGINQEDILDFMKDHADSDMVPLPEKPIRSRDQLDVDLWRHFNHALNSILSNEISSRVETTLKINGNAEDFQIDIDSIREDMKSGASE